MTHAFLFTHRRPLLRPVSGTVLVVILCLVMTMLMSCSPQQAWATTVVRVANESVGYDGINYEVPANALHDRDASAANRPVVTIVDTENFAKADAYSGWSHTTSEKATLGQVVYYKGPNGFPSGRSSRVIGNGERNAPALFTIRYPNAVVKQGQSEPEGDVLITVSGVVFRSMRKDASSIKPATSGVVRELFETDGAWLMNATASGSRNVFGDTSLHAGGTFIYHTVSFVKSGTNELLSDDGLRLHFYDLDQPNVNGEYSGENREGVQFQKTDKNHHVMLHTNSTIKVEDLSDGLFFGSSANDENGSFLSGIIFDMPAGEEFMLWRSGTNCGTQIGMSIPEGQGPPVRQPPAKKVDKQEAAVGDTLHFTATQKMVTSSNHYPSLVFTDKLQTEIDYVDKSVKIADGAKDITGRCTITYTNHTLTISVDPSYLASQALEGQTLSVEFDAKVVGFPQGEYVNNVGTFKMGPWAPLDTPPTETKIQGGKIELTKSIDFEHGIDDVATYTLTVHSVGKGLAKDIKVSDVSLPSGFAIVEGSAKISGGTGGNVQAAGKNLQASIATLNPGAKATVSFKVACPASFNGAEVFNTAQATFSNPAPDAQATVKATDGMWINNAELDVTKKADAFEYRVGDTATYTVTVVNKTKGTIAKNVHIDDTDLPAHAKIDAGSINISGVPSTVAYPIDGNGAHKTEERKNGNVTATKKGNGFVIDIPYLPYNQLVTITYSAVCTKDSNGLESFNSAVVSLDNPVPNMGKITSRDGVWTNDAEFIFTKSVDEYETQVDDTVHYTVEFQNTASGTIAKDVVLSDVTLPAGLVLQPDTIQVEGVPNEIDYNIDGQGEHKTEKRTNTATVNTDGNGFTVSILYVPAGVPIQVSYDAVPTEEVNGAEIVNTATLTCANMLDDATLEAEALVWVNTPHLAIAKQVKEKRTRYKVGDTVTYQIGVVNIQVGTFARNLVIDDAFERSGMQLDRSSVVLFDAEGEIIGTTAVRQNRSNANFTVETGSNLVCTQENYQRWHGGEATEQETLNPLEEERQAELWVEFQAVVTDADLAGLVLQNTASATADNAAVVHDTENIKIEGKPQNGHYVTTHKTSDPAPNTAVAPGETIAYTLVHTNTGVDTAPFALVRDYIPVGTAYVDGSVSGQGVYVPADAEGNKTGRPYVEWVLRDIPTNESVSTTFSVTVDTDAPRMLENHALTTALERPIEPGKPDNPEPGNKSNTVYHPTITDENPKPLPVPAFIDIVKLSEPAPGPIHPGENISYTLKVTNTGGTEAHDIAVFDALPAYTSHKEHAPDFSATLSSDGRAMGWNIPQLAAGASVELSFVVAVDNDTPATTTVDNQASWEWDTPGIPSKPLENTTNIVQHRTPEAPTPDPGTNPVTDPDPDPKPDPEPASTDPTPEKDPAPAGKTEPTEDDPDPKKQATQTPTTKSNQKTTPSSSTAQNSATPSSPAARAIGKTGDWVRAHPALALALVGLAGTVMAAAAQRRHTRVWKKRLLR